MASQLTEIVKDPFIAASLPISKLEVADDGHTFTFEVKSSQDAKPYTDDKGKEVKPEKGKRRFSISPTT